VDKLKGEVASPAELKKQVDEIKHDYDKRLQSVELSQKILQWLTCAVIVLIIGTMLRAGWFDRAIELANRSGATALANPSVSPTPAMVPDHLGYYILGAGVIVGLCTLVAAIFVQIIISSFRKVPKAKKCHTSDSSTEAISQSVKISVIPRPNRQINSQGHSVPCFPLVDRPPRGTRRGHSCWSPPPCDRRPTPLT
jgi:hypothetical protein